MLQEQREGLRGRMNTQKAQLQMLVKENQVMQLALDGLQHEIQVLTRQLRRYMPETEVASEDLEAILNKFDKVARNGGGAYVRLNKEARLREVAAEAREKREAERREAAEQEEPQEGRPSSTNSVLDILEPPRPSPRTATLKSLTPPAIPARGLQTPTAVCFPSFPSARGEQSPTSPTAPVRSPQSRAASHSRPDRRSSVDSRMPTRSNSIESNGPVVQSSTSFRKASLLPQAPPEKRGGSLSLGAALGTRGSMAILRPRFGRQSSQM